MSTSGFSVGSAAGSPITISGLASGLDTSSIISALMGVERLPITHLTNQQTKLQSQENTLKTLQGSLQELGLEASEFTLPSLFETSQGATSSEPTRVSAVTTSGAAVGGHQVEVTQLANSAQRSFTFTSPTAEEKLTIDGNEYSLKAGESAKELANGINSDSKGTVYAAVLESGTIVLSNRATGNTGTEFIKVTGGALTEKAETAKEGKNAEYTVDGVKGSSASNIVTEAIPGVTLTFTGLTTTAGPVTIDVQPPGPSVSVVEAQVQSFVKLYNSTIAAIETQLTTKPPEKPQNASELAAGSLFGDFELSSVLGKMREAMYEPIEGLETGMSSPADIGISTGGPSGSGATSAAVLDGQLTLNTAKLSEAIKSNPAGVQQMLQQWSHNLQGTLNGVAEPVGGTLEARISGDASQVAQLNAQIVTMNEILAQREKALQETYAKLESVISQNSAQGNWLTSQEKQLQSSGI